MGEYLNVRTLAFMSAVVSAILCIPMGYIYVAAGRIPVWVMAVWRILPHRGMWFWP
jgi:hypothetical protein